MRAMKALHGDIDGDEVEVRNGAFGFGSFFGVLPRDSARVAKACGSLVVLGDSGASVDGIQGLPSWGIWCKKGHRVSGKDLVEAFSEALQVHELHTFGFDGMATLTDGVAVDNASGRQALIEGCAICASSLFRFGAAHDSSRMVAVLGSVGVGKSTLLAVSALGAWICSGGQLVLGICAEMPCGPASVRVDDRDVEIWRAPKNAPQPPAVIAARALIEAGLVDGETLGRVWGNPGLDDFKSLDARLAALSDSCGRRVVLVFDEFQDMFKIPDQMEACRRWMVTLSMHIQCPRHGFAVFLTGATSQLRQMLFGGEIVGSEFPSYQTNAWKVNSSKIRVVHLHRTWTRNGFRQLCEAVRGSEKELSEEDLEALFIRSKGSVRELATLQLASRGTGFHLAGVEGERDLVDAIVRSLRDPEYRNAITARPFAEDDDEVRYGVYGGDRRVNNVFVPLQYVIYGGKPLDLLNAVRANDKGILLLHENLVEVAIAHPGYMIESLDRLTRDIGGLTFEERDFIVRPITGLARSVGESLVARALVRPDAFPAELDMPSMRISHEQPDLTAGPIIITDECVSVEDEDEKLHTICFDTMYDIKYDYFGADLLAFCKRPEAQEIAVVLIRIILGISCTLAPLEGVNKLERGWLGGEEAKDRRDARGSKWTAGDQAASKKDDDRSVLETVAHQGLRSRIISLPEGWTLKPVAVLVTNKEVPNRKVWEDVLASFGGLGLVLDQDRMESRWEPAVRLVSALSRTNHFVTPTRPDFSLTELAQAAGTNFPWLQYETTIAKFESALLKSGLPLPIASLLTHMFPGGVPASLERKDFVDLLIEAGLEKSHALVVFCNLSP